MNILEFFRTAPKTKSDKVLELQRAGKTYMLLQAIEDERREDNRGTGRSEHGEVIVRRVGIGK